MDAMGIVPDGRALQTVAWAAARGGEWTEALVTLRRLRSAGGQPLAPAEFLGVALSVCESIEATFALLRAAAADGIEVDPLTYYTAVVQGWQGATALPPAETAVAMLRGLADGTCPSHHTTTPHHPHLHPASRACAPATHGTSAHVCAERRHRCAADAF